MTLDDAWALAEATLPPKWVMGGVQRAGASPMQRREWKAYRLGPWSRSSRSCQMDSAYGESPAAALQALAEKDPESL